MLVLLAALVPFRGAVAAAMPCAKGNHHAMAMQGASDHGQPTPCAHHHSSGDTGVFHDDGGCSACAAFCSATPMASAMPVVQTPSEIARVTFPSLSASAPSFHSDGQDRPPRTI